MKKKILAVLCVAVMVFALTACGSSMKDSKYLGTWKATTAEMSGISISVESVYSGGLAFTLNDDGSCDLKAGKEEESGKWKETEDGFSVEDTFEVKVDGDKGTMEYSGVTFTFERNAK